MQIAYFISDNAMPLLTALTVAILYVYTKETYLLRKEAQKQTENLFTPHLSIRNSEDGLLIKNLGMGIAREVKFNQQILVRGEPILMIPAIGSGEERNLYYLDQQNKGAWNISSYEISDDILLTYSDTLGNIYAASFKREYADLGVFTEVSQGRAPINL